MEYLFYKKEDTFTNNINKLYKFYDTKNIDQNVKHNIANRIFKLLSSQSENKYNDKIFSLIIKIYDDVTDDKLKYTILDNFFKKKNIKNKHSMFNFIRKKVLGENKFSKINIENTKIKIQKELNEKLNRTITKRIGKIRQVEKLNINDEIKKYKNLYEKKNISNISKIFAEEILTLLIQKHSRKKFISFTRNNLFTKDDVELAKKVFEKVNNTELQNKIMFKLLKIVKYNDIGLSESDIDELKKFISRTLLNGKEYDHSLAQSTLQVKIKEKTISSTNTESELDKLIDLYKKTHNNNNEYSLKKEYARRIFIKLVENGISQFSDKHLNIIKEIYVKNYVDNEDLKQKILVLCYKKYKSSEGLQKHLIYQFIDDVITKNTGLKSHSIPYNQIKQYIEHIKKNIKSKTPYFSSHLPNKSIQYSKLLNKTSNEYTLKFLVKDIYDLLVSKKISNTTNNNVKNAKKIYDKINIKSKYIILDKLLKILENNTKFKKVTNINELKKFIFLSLQLNKIDNLTVDKCTIEFMRFELNKMSLYNFVEQKNYSRFDNPPSEREVASSIVHLSLETTLKEITEKIEIIKKILEQK